MNAREKSILTRSIECDDSVLVLVDVQDSFLEKLSALESRLLVSRVSWLVQIANVLGIPVIATAEDIPNMGGVTQNVADHFLPGTPVHNKMVFDLAANPEIFQVVQQTNRKTVVLTGLETDVCIAQSALGLLARGYQVAIVEDATNSPGAAHEYGLQRMRSAGVLVSNVKSLYYEWIRTVKRSEEFSNLFRQQIGFPEGVTL